jgi:hypothetical protein
MKRTAPFLGVLLASSLTLAAIAGCQSAAPTTPDQATVRSGGQTTAPAKPPTGQTGTAQPGQPTTGATAGTAQSAAVTASTDLAALLASEREAEDYNALAGDEDKAAYRLFDLDEKGQPRVAREGEMVTTAMPGPDRPEGRPTRPEMPLGDKVATAARAIAEGGLAMGRPEGKGPAMDPKARAEMMAKAREAAKARAEEGRKKHEERVKEAQEKAFKGKLVERIKAEIEKRAKDRKENAKDRLAKAKGKLDKAREAMKREAWVDNGDGTKSKTFTFDVSKTDGDTTTSRSRKIVRTVRVEDNVLVSLVSEFNDVRASGGSTTTNRAKTLQGDGSYKVVFHSVIVLADGTTRTADWEKSIAPDGKITGTGKIVWTKDGEVVKTVDINLGGTEEEEAAKIEDGKESAEVVVPAEGDPTATVTTEGGTTAPVAVEVEPDGSVEIKDETAEAPAEAEPDARA